MLWDGVQVRFSKTLGYRESNPKFDFNLDGEPVERNYVSIVRLKDCIIENRDDGKYYNAIGAPSIPINHGGTNYGYGKWRKYHSIRGIWIHDKIYHDYWTVTMYVVYNGKVYQGAIRHAPKKCSCGFEGNNESFRHHINEVTGAWEQTPEHHTVEKKDG
jgi:hypothetical protein